jgi:hypothetical protein
MLLLLLQTSGSEYTKEYGDTLVEPAFVIGGLVAALFAVFLFYVLFIKGHHNN